MSALHPIVRLEAVNVVAGEKCLLKSVDLIVQAKERIAIIGANGAGKTTLLKTLTGMVPATSGSVEVLGKTISSQSTSAELRKLRARIGQVFQGLHLVGRLSALENVLVGALGRCDSILTCARLFPADQRARAQSTLDSVGMGHAARFRVDRLSGGERQKVAIARALNQNPEIILADEPTANLDPIAAAEIADLLARIAAERDMTLITVAHTLKLLPNLAERIIGLKSGQIAFDRSIDEIGEDQLTQLYKDGKLPSQQPRRTTQSDRV